MRTSGTGEIHDQLTFRTHETELIKSLPWGKDFEVDVFRKPDFTALEILTFATGGELRR